MIPPSLIVIFDGAKLFGSSGVRLRSIGVGAVSVTNMTVLKGRGGESLLPGEAGC